MRAPLDRVAFKLRELEAKPHSVLTEPPSRPRMRCRKIIEAVRPLALDEFFARPRK